MLFQAIQAFEIYLYGKSFENAALKKLFEIKLTEFRIHSFTMDSLDFQEKSCIMM